MPRRSETRAFLSLVLRSPLTVFVSCAVSFVSLLLLILGSGFEGLDFFHGRQARLWHLLGALLPTFSVACVLVVFEHLRGNGAVWPRAWGDRMGVALCALLCLVLTNFPFMAQLRRQPFPPGLDLPLGVPHWYTKSVVLCLLVGLVVTLLYAGLFGVHIQLIRCLSKYRSPRKDYDGKVLEKDVLRYQRLRSQLDLFLRTLAVLDGLAILTVGVLRNLLNVLLPGRSEIMPKETVMGFGLYFTALLASVYLPARMTLTKVGQVLADRLVRPPLPRNGNWKDWVEEQQAVQTWLGLQGSALAELQQGISVLVPFLASISSLLLSEHG